jgi:ankyrin repeat protein
MNALPLSERREAIRIFATTRNREGLCSVQLPVDDVLVQAVKYEDDLEAATTALEAGACADAVEDLDFIPLLRHAIDNENPEMVALLLQHQAHPDTKDLHGNTPLMQAVLDPCNPTIIQLLLQAGARTDLLDEQYIQPHCLAAHTNQLEALKLLHQAGADLSWIDGGGMDALIWAAAGGAVETTTYLLSNGADPTRRDGDSKSATDWAREEGYEELATLLENNYNSPSPTKALRNEETLGEGAGDEGNTI